LKDKGFLIGFATLIGSVMFWMLVNRFIPAGKSDRQPTAMAVYLSTKVNIFHRSLPEVYYFYYDSVL
jgi:hypothetical protein